MFVATLKVIAYMEYIQYGKSYRFSKLAVHPDVFHDCYFPAKRVTFLLHWVLPLSEYPPIVYGW